MTLARTDDSAETGEAVGTRPGTAGECIGDAENLPARHIALTTMRQRQGERRSSRKRAAGWADAEASLPAPHNRGAHDEDRHCFFDRGSAKDALQAASADVARQLEPSLSSSSSATQNSMMPRPGASGR